MEASLEPQAASQANLAEEDVNLDLPLGEILLRIKNLSTCLAHNQKRIIKQGTTVRKQINYNKKNRLKKKFFSTFSWSISKLA